MILYQLKCPAEHFFEGWFRDGAGYEEQSAAGGISCPVCGDTAIGKAPMAPRVMRGATVPTPVEMTRTLRKLRRTIEENCENVGDNFAEEARKIHYGETESRAIYGDATAEQAEELADEGIEFSRIPWLPPADN